jgi:RimJ/RimL family protein N-acetyltransferase
MRIIPEMPHLFPRSSGVILRQPEAGDVASLADLEFDSDVKQYSKIPELPKDKWAAEFTRGLGSHDLLTVVSLPEMAVAGRASISRVEFNNGDPIYYGPYNHELSIFIAKPFWSRGLGRIVAQDLIRLAFSEFQAKGIVAIAHPENTAALTLLRCFGFAQIGVKVAQGWQNGHLEFALSRSA